MITFLEGTLVEALLNQITVNVQGVGYQILIPLSSFDRLPPPGESIRILTHLSIREDAHILYGFLAPVERDLFRLLVQHVSGVGPKLALSILSGMSVDSFKTAVINSDLTAISRISGVGKKTAERVVLELKDKLGVAAEWEAASRVHAKEDSTCSDAVLALISLGYKQTEAHKAVRQVLNQSSSASAISSEELVRKALKLLI